VVAVLRREQARDDTTAWQAYDRHPPGAYAWTAAAQLEKREEVCRACLLTFELRDLFISKPNIVEVIGGQSFRCFIESYLVKVSSIYEFMT
jgi:hypothetical protein